MVDALRSLSEDTTTARSMERPVVIVGMGPAGLRTAHELLQGNPKCPLVLYGDEPWKPYNRTKLSSLLLGEVARAAIDVEPKWAAEADVVTHYGCAVVAIDREARTVTDAAGRVQPYSDLVLATGSRPHVPAIAGSELPGVYTFRDLSDAQRLMARMTRSRRTVVLGGGLLGLEAARAMQRARTEVIVVEHMPRLMANQLDAEAAELLRERVLALGIQVLLGESVCEVLGTLHVEGVQLRKSAIACDTVVIATGIRSNVELALQAGLKIGRGILVNDRMEASDPHIFAVGECAEHMGKVYGLVAPGLEQAAVAADRILGGAAQYRGSIAATRLKVLGANVFSMGQVGEEEHPLSVEHCVYQDFSQGVYRKLVLRRHRLIGAIGVGEWSEINRIQEAITNRRPAWFWQLRRFARHGVLWPQASGTSVAQWPSHATVCTCTGVNHSTLRSAIADGCASLDCLARRTGASTVCGSCKPLLAELLGADAPLAPVSGGRSLAVAVVIGALLMAVWNWWPPIGEADSVLSPVYPWASLWQDATWKQVSGFTLLGFSLVGVLLSLRKRWQRFSLGSFAAWRGVHALLGAATLLVLVGHTGLQFGERLNAWLLTDFLALTLLGLLAAAAALAEARPRPLTRRLRGWSNWLHLLLTWPFPVLLGFHVLSVYYF